MQQQAVFARIGAILGGLGVILGAFGAHGLKSRVSADMLAVFEVGVRYQMYHALAILAVAVAAPALWQSAWARRACIWWIFGTAIFSGSLYLLALTGIKWLGAVTPIGGVAFIGGWGMAALAAKGLAAPRER